MTTFRLILNLLLVAALAVICPIRCQADAARTGEAVVEETGCPCCHGEPSESPVPSAPEGCSDCVCDGAVDGPRVAAVELPPAVPGGLPVATGDLARPSACGPEAPDGRPDVPAGAKLRLLMASLVI